MKRAEARARFEMYMRIHYPRVGLDSIEQTSTPGYWRDKEPQMHPGHPLHSFIGCNGPFHGTYYFAEHGLRGFDGTFISPFRVWHILRDNPDPDGQRREDESGWREV